MTAKMAVANAERGAGKARARGAGAAERRGAARAPPPL